MSRALIPFLLSATPSWSHPGHDAGLAHVHSWDWSQLLIWLAIFAVGALVAWKSK
jgi:hypothetical protein